MFFKPDANRRSFLATLAAAAGALFAPARLFRGGKAGTASPAPGGFTGFGSTGNVYDELGVTTVINGEGTMTVLGGSLMRPEVEAAMTLASQHFCSIPELEVAAGKRIAQMLKLPEGYGAIVTSGAARS